MQGPSASGQAYACAQMEPPSGGVKYKRNNLQVDQAFAAPSTLVAKEHEGQAWRLARTWSPQETAPSHSCSEESSTGSRVETGVKGDSPDRESTPVAAFKKAGLGTAPAHRLTAESSRSWLLKKD